MKNAQYSPKDVKKCCENKLDITFKPGKEFNGWYFFNGKKVARITIPKAKGKGKKDIKRKTYGSMAKQLKLTTSDFDLFLDCPLGSEEYKTIIREYLRNKDRGTRS